MGRLGAFWVKRFFGERRGGLGGGFGGTMGAGAGGDREIGLGCAVHCCLPGTHFLMRSSGVLPGVAVSD